MAVAAGGIRARRSRAAPPAEPPSGRSVAAPPEAPPLKVPGDGLGGRIRSLFRGQTTEETWRRLEETLVRADVGPGAAAEIVARVRRTYRPQMDPAEVGADEVARAFDGDRPWQVPEGSPAVVMVVGVNGSGKTTTIGKLAYLLSRDGRKVTLAASDTFRAAAGEQLDTWATRAGSHVVSQARGADPGAVAFDALQAAKARGSDVLIVDTAGRLHTRQPLMDELKKVRRVLEKDGGRVDEVLLVLDATTGQNGIAQARAFTEAVGVTGLVLTKLDGTARGGIVVAVRQELGIPVKLIGTGEGQSDLATFDPAAFARQIVA
ncbi:MAG TPA: signal recognition particle-docking protein FtsY [Acidimicrobiia bacterium]|nr:signal recognition particle-docking protein FtsY [Acidimicrobiia bacterium]